MDASTTTPAVPITAIPPPGVGGMIESPPVTVNQQQSYSPAAGHGSVGAVIGVVAAIAVLGIIAGVVGRLCHGRAVMGYGGRFDLENWVETKCSSCVDGHVAPPPRRAVHVAVHPPFDGGGRRENGSDVGVGLPRREIRTGEERETPIEQEQEREVEQEQEQEQVHQRQHQQQQGGGEDEHEGHPRRRSHVEEL